MHRLPVPRMMVPTLDRSVRNETARPRPVSWQKRSAAGVPHSTPGSRQKSTGRSPTVGLSTVCANADEPQQRIAKAAIRYLIIASVYELPVLADGDLDSKT